MRNQEYTRADGGIYDSEELNRNHGSGPIIFVGGGDANGRYGPKNGSYGGYAQDHKTVIRLLYRILQLWENLKLVTITFIAALVIFEKLTALGVFRP